MLAVAYNAAHLPYGGVAAAVLIVTAAWTGARWGEIAALHRPLGPYVVRKAEGGVACQVLPSGP